MLSDFFNSKNDDEKDWFFEDYNNIMVNKIKKTFEEFGKDYEFDINDLYILLLNISINICLFWYFFRGRR